MLGVIESKIPLQYMVSFDVIIPSVKAATAVSGLNVEPGAILVWVARFTSGVDLSLTKICSMSNQWFLKKD